ncbi:MAG: carbohydrate ABC transporter permease [Tessaracoccus sp.]
MKSDEHKTTRVLLVVALVMACLVQLLPFWVTLTTSTKARTDLSSQWAFPISGFTLENFGTAMAQGNILRAIFNSAVVTAGSTVLICVLAALAAYPIARRKTLGNNIVLGFVVSLMMVPPLSILVPLYSFMNRIGGLNTYWGAILVLTAGQLPLAIFLYTNFIRALPTSIDEAAVVDGAGYLTRIFRVIFPLLKPVTATVIIMCAVNVWNEFAISGFLLTSPERQTIAPAIATFFGAQTNNLGAAAAGSLMAVAPILVVYLFLQRYFISGMVAGSGK